MTPNLRMPFLLSIAGLIGLGAAGCAHHGNTNYDRNRDGYRSESRRDEDWRRRGSRPDEAPYGGSGELQAYARDLAERSQSAARLASSGRRPRNHDESELVGQMNEFAERAARFDEKLESSDEAWDYRRDVDKLNKIARTVGERMRESRIRESTYSEWNGVLQALDSLNQAAAGYDGRSRGPGRRRIPEDRVDVRPSQSSYQAVEPQPVRPRTD